MSLSFGALKEEMERRKREKEALVKAAAEAAPAAAVGAGGKKYLRRGDIEALKAGTAAAGAPSAGASAPAGPHAAAAAAAPVSAISSSSSAASAPASVSAHAATLQLPRGEVLRRLRRHGQVATYFGETDAARAERLYAYEAAHSLQAAEREDTGVKGGFEIGSTGRRTSAGRAHAGYDAGANDDDDDDDDDDDEKEGKRAAKRARTGEGDAPAGASAAGEGAFDAAAAAAADGGGDDDDDDGGGSVGSGGSKERSRDGAGASSSSSSSRHAAKPRTTSADAAAYAGPGGDKYKYVHRFFKGLMHEWEDELAARSEADKTTAAGLAATRLLKQCKDFVRPLFTALKGRSVPPDILSLTAEIVDHCRARNYHMAGDAYIRLAIGNAAWPIGVSAVGLHERAARQKVAEGIQAHVMNDEAQRKYITTLKRLISYAQQRYPSDPSRSVYS